MFALLKKLSGPVAFVASACLAPVVAWRRADAGQVRALVVGIHAVAVAALMAGLMAIQWWFQLETFVRSSLTLVRLLWLPLVGGLLYAIIWSTWLIARTLRSSQDCPLFDATARSLRGGLDRLQRAGIDVSQSPLYLVLGSPAGGVRDFFDATGVELTVQPPPEELDESVQVCGNRDAIYVCCRDASLLGSFARRAAELRTHERQAEVSRRRSACRAPAHRWSTASPDQLASLPTAAGELTVADNASTTRGAPFAAATDPGPVATETLPPPGNGDSDDHGDGTLSRLDRTFEELETLTDETSDRGNAGVLQRSQPKSNLLKLETAEADRLSRGLAAVCHELAEVREPYCPINGVLVLIPLDAADHIETADHVGMRLERDLATIATATETTVSAQLVVCDLDQCVGSQAFLDRFPAAQRGRRLGASLPVTPASEPEAGPEAVDRAVRWICETLFPPLGIRLMRRDASDRTLDRQHQDGNRQIHRLVHSMRTRRDGLSRMLRRVVVGTAGMVRLRGCHLAATGPAGTSRQAYAEGLLPLILDIQNEVQWSPQRRRRDRQQRLAAATIYAVTVTLTAWTLVWIVTAVR